MRLPDVATPPLPDEATGAAPPRRGLQVAWVRLLAAPLPGAGAAPGGAPPRRGCGPRGALPNSRAASSGVPALLALLYGKKKLIGSTCKD